MVDSARPAGELDYAIRVAGSHLDVDGTPCARFYGNRAEVSWTQRVAILAASIRTPFDLLFTLLLTPRYFADMRLRAQFVRVRNLPMRAICLHTQFAYTRNLPTCAICLRARFVFPC